MRRSYCCRKNRVTKFAKLTVEVQAYHTAPNAAMESALDALAIVEKLKASEQSVFNGVAWQLLYQPFTPFFVDCTATIANRTPEYLEHLRSLPRFLQSMAEFYSEALQLKHIADRFVEHVEQTVAKNTRPNPLQDSRVPVEDPEAVLRSMDNASFNPQWQKDFMSVNSPLSTPWTNAGQSAPNGDGLAEKVNPYFDWFSWAFAENA